MTAEEDLARLRAAWLDFAFEFAKGLGLIRLVRRFGMQPKPWVLEREQRQ